MDESVIGDRPNPFSIVFTTCDRRHGTGGKRIVFDKAVLTKKRIRSVVASTDGKKRSPDKTLPIMVKNLTSHEIRKVHIPLIESINDHFIL